jgi:pyruvate dehydrogenase E2 component (dihydrolipoamide acetyltransferase)
MRYEFKLPDLAEGMVEGEIVGWLVATGDAVIAEQPVVEVMTDKATVVISSPRAGTVLELGYQSGDLAPVGTTLFVLDVEGGAGEVVESKVETSAAPKAAVVAPRAEAVPAYTASVPRGADAPPAVPRGAGKSVATPATRRLARELGVDVGQVEGTGPGGRVTPEDVRAFVESHSRREASAPVTAASAHAMAPLIARRATGEESEKRTPLRGLRRAIYDTMTRSKGTAAHFTYVEEVDCTNLVLARERLKAASDAAGVRLSYLPFIAKASLLALRAFPKMNATMDDAAGEFVQWGHHHLGIAAATDAGLAVPVIRFASDLTLIELAARVLDLSDKARKSRLSPEEARGSTFTITSLGKIGGLFATPIINHPEVAILGIHKMEPRAVVRDGAIVARQMMNISVSFDHRVIDGHEGAAFAQRIKTYLEDPDLMLLEMR